MTRVLFVGNATTARNAALISNLVAAGMEVVLDRGDGKINGLVFEGAVIVDESGVTIEADGKTETHLFGECDWVGRKLSVQDMEPPVYFNRVRTREAQWKTERRGRK